MQNKKKEIIFHDMKPTTSSSGIRGNLHNRKRAQ